MDRQYNVVGIGKLLWDLLPQKKVLGGAPANFAFHANELGAKGYVISAIGKDKLGVEIESEFGSKNLELRLSKLDYPTGIVKVKLNVHGIPEYEIIENAAWDYIPLKVNPTFNLQRKQTRYVLVAWLKEMIFRENQ